MTPAQRFNRLLEEDPRYDPEAYNFVYEALEWIMERKQRLTGEKNPNIGVRILLEGMRLYAIEEFGLLARTVFEMWGVSSTDDFGEIVFNLVKYKLMGKNPEDLRSEFHNVFDFRQAFRTKLAFASNGDPQDLSLLRVVIPEIA